MAKLGQEAELKHANTRCIFFVICIYRLTVNYYLGTCFAQLKFLLSFTWVRFLFLLLLLVLNDTTLFPSGSNINFFVKYSDRSHNLFWLIKKSKLNVIIDYWNQPYSNFPVKVLHQISINISKPAWKWQIARGFLYSSEFLEFIMYKCFHLFQGNSAMSSMLTEQIAISISCCL